MKIYTMSDCHTDYKENMQWRVTRFFQLPLPPPTPLTPAAPSLHRVEAHCAATSRPHDALILAGDVSDSLPTLRRTLTLLSSSYGTVFYTAGNHELWVRRGEREQHDSLGKLSAITAMCAELGVKIGPVRLPGGAWVVPLWSWYHASWDREPDVPGAMPIEKVMMDFHACCWDSEPTLRGRCASSDDALARYFDALNDPGFKTVLDKISKERAEAQEAAAAASGAGGAPAPAGPVVLSFSHFLPLQELLPEKRLLHYPNLAKACGSDPLAARVAALAPDAHVFGHTHFTQDHIGSDGVRYVQWPLGYPRDQRGRRDGGAGWEPLLLYDSEEGLTAQRRAYWSDYYRQNQRTPHVVTPAPWVRG